MSDQGCIAGMANILRATAALDPHSQVSERCGGVLCFVEARIRAFYMSNQSVLARTSQITFERCGGGKKDHHPAHFIR
jgi:hypothetical protein